MFSISGTVNISGNTDGNKKTSNVFFRTGLFFDVTDSLEGSCIGVTVQKPPTQAKPTPVKVAGGKEYGISTADWSCFFSDKDGYEILRKETTDGSEEKNPLNELYLALPGSCDLSGLTLSTEGVKLEPDFQENKTTYTATVGNDVESIDITATLKNTPAEGEEKPLTMKIDAESAKKINSGEKQTVKLNEGKNTIAITVTSGGMSKTYTIEIERKAPDVPAEYKVTLNGDDGTGTALKSYTYGMGAKLPTDWTKTGYDFAGWYEDESCEGTAVTEISATTTGDKEYWAKWTAKTYTVAYSSNGGTIANEDNFKKYTYGTGMTLPTPVKTGYTFDGWYEQSDFSGSKVTGISATDTGAKTYYAKWTLSSYTISYELDGGTVTGNPTTYTVESSTITLNNPTKEGYTFTGWSGTGLTGEQNTTVTIPKGSTENREYTAHWTAAGYKVTLEGKGGTGGTSLSTYTHGTKVELPTDWMKNGYTFAGWYEDESCEGTAVTEIPANATGDKKYWAGWTANSYTISYNLDGGTATGNPTTYTVENNAITLVNPTKEGYTFTGWGGTGLTGEQNTAVTIPKGSTGNRTYTAHWKLADYTVTLHPNGGTGGTDLTSYTFGMGAAFPTDWTKKGYIFGGWYANADCSGAEVKEISATATGDKEYWAKWTDSIAPVIGTLTYNYQPKNLWQWLIGKDSLVITVLVTEEGSGADKINYTLMPDGGTAEQKTAEINNGKAEITLSPDFKGTVSITCTDKANNTSASVTVGAGAAPNGIIIEDNAPQIAFQAKNAERLPSGEYKTAPDITVTVADNKDNAISGGIASVSYKIGNGSEKTVAHDYTTGIIVNDSFTIPASEIPAGETEITVTATDNAGNSNPQRYTVKVHSHSGTLVPAVEPTCTTAGNKAYYTCSCGKEFSNSGCTDEITDHAEVIKKALGHDFIGKYQSDENGHWKVCSRCNVAQTAENHVFDDDNDTDCNQCGYRRNTGNQGNVSKDVEKDEKAPDTVLSDSAEELADTILTEEEKGQIGNGTDIKFILNVKDAGDTVSGGDKTAVQQTLDGNAAVKGFSVGQYLDISLFKVIGDTRSAISQTARKLTIVINVPESLKRKDSAKPRTYAIIRVHDGVAEVLEDLDSAADTVTIATDRFSAYALVYKEAGSGADVTPAPTPGGGDKPTPTPGGDKPSPTPDGSNIPSPTPGGDKPSLTPDGSNTPSPTPGSSKPAPTPGGGDNVTKTPSPSEKPEQASGKEKRKIQLHSGLKAIQTGKKLQVSWGRVTGADGYSVYVQYCGKDFTSKSLNQVKSGKKTKITVKKVNGKKLDTTKNFKLYVVAWKWKDGKKSTLAKTLTVHIAGKDSVKYTNVKNIKLKKTSYTLKKGGAVTLRPKAVLYDKRKKQLSAAHCKELRYLSSNKKVATVTAGGKVKAKGTGECTIYVFAKNGCRRKIKIKVKK